ncbi:VanZ family protein [Clostridium ljungdahlii]|uniref:VanZ like family protein n=1 Tax=Clostridium ljungdahlii (strain ATCC 55383 / DSM 13528 / PETC) TaxID=748727 RepID=D8GQM5_CLOLD|nr:VanZ family protein [Clostridium ljungdahlii]ADK14148.1 VanZ like protein [Clostridium ljungdahlii DSM 13528]OAA86175.1 VanZ like family protein [Clostridium ljungdahlii DSM 13528]
MSDIRNWVLIGYEMLSVLIPFFITYVILHVVFRKDKMRNKKRFLIWNFIFALYIFGVLHFTGAGTLYNIKMYGFKINPNEINLIPFSGNIDIIEYVLNIILFIPLGFLIPLIWTSWNKWKSIIIGSSFSILIELSQLFNTRCTDIDDFILNTLGAIVGYCLYKMLNRVKKKDIKTSYLEIEPFIFICAMFLGRFFIFNEFGLAKIVYKF